MKYKIFELSIFILLIGTYFVVIMDTLPANVDDSNLVGYWSFDEGSGTTVHDSSIYRNHGIIIGASWETDGKINGALSFDGINDYISVPDDSSLHTDDLTVSLWVKPFDDSDNFMIDKYGLSEGFFIRIIDDKWVFHVNGLVVESISTVQIEEWTFIVGKTDGNFLYIYINGVLDNMYDAPRDVVNSANYTLYMGTGGVSYFKGVLDEVRIYKRALSDNEIGELYNQPPYKPSNPNPNDYATGIDVNSDLSWTAGDPDNGDIVTYNIYFGTASNPPLKKSGHASTTYDPGMMNTNTGYYWKIVAQDNKGSTTTSSVWYFTTVEYQSNELPIAEFTWIPSAPKADQTITFDASASSDPDSLMITKYEWDWNNDGTYDDYENTSTVTHTWAQEGYYNVKLQVTDGEGATNTKTTTIVVSSADENGDLNGKGTPGFEIIFLLVGLLFVFYWKRKKH